jgi:hypothetical protein
MFDCVEKKVKNGAIKQEGNSTVEIRVTHSKGRAAVVFHQTGLFDVEKREALIGYWKGVVGRMDVALVGG